MSRTLYAYTTDWNYEGRISSGMIPWIKVGDTKNAVEDRVKQQDNESNPEILKIIGSWNLPDGYRDYDVHNILESHEFKRLRHGQKLKDYGSVGRREWFECTLEDIDCAINELINGVYRPDGFSMRNEQKEAVHKALNYFTNAWDGTSVESFLFNCKMRFGKTFAAYELMRELQNYYGNNFKVIILTYKPAVLEEWFRGLMMHVNYEGWNFVSVDGNKVLELPDGNSIVFASFQDILGKKLNGKPKKKFSKIMKDHFDLMILDEVHYGTRTDKAIKLIKSISHDLELHLSGTPIRILMSNEFAPEQIYTWDYVDEQIAKARAMGTSRQFMYESLPTMHMYAYQIGDMVREDSSLFHEDEMFTFAKLFAVDEDTGEFVNRADVERFLAILASPQKRRYGITSPYHCNDIEFKDIKNSFWRLPNVAAVGAMTEMLRNHPWFSKFGVVYAAGDNDGEDADTLRLAKNYLREADEGKTIGTIILSCGKLDTGVSLPTLGSVFILSDTKSPEVYMQNIFRCQTSYWTDTVQKTDCYVFDFNPNRMLEILYSYSEHMADEKDGDTNDYLRILLDVLSIQAYEDNSFRKLDTSDIVRAATSIDTVGNRFSSERYIHPEHVNNEILKILKGVQGAKDKKHTTTISEDEEIKNGKTHKIVRDPDGREMTKNEVDELKRKLLKVKMLIPRFIFVVDEEIHSVDDIINTKSQGIFEETMGISTNEFSNMVEAGCFNERKLNVDIHAFSIGMWG